MTQLQYSLELPESWIRQTDSYAIIVKETNALLDKKDLESLSQAVINLFELVYGLLEYLEVDAIEEAKTQKVINNPRIRTYENQVLSLLLLLEEISQSHPSLAIDRYVLYLEVFKKFVYVDLDAITLFSNLITKISAKINPKKISESYLIDYCTFCLEISILTFESKNYTSSIEIYQEITKLLFEPLKELSNSLNYVPFLGLAICYERVGNFNEASNMYLETYNRIHVRLQSNMIDEFPLQIIHEVMFFGYICSFFADKTDRLNDFYSLIEFSDKDITYLMNSIHSMVVFGFPMFEAFKHINIESIITSINYYLTPSYIQSNQNGNSLGLIHIDPAIFLPNIEMKLTNKGAQKAIVIVSTQHLKDIQVIIGKNFNLPALNVLPDISSDNNFVIVDGQKFYIDSQFAFGTSFSSEIELTVNFQKKQILKRKLTLVDQIPPFYLIDLDKEIADLTSVKEGSIKQFDVIWHKNMSFIDVIKAVAMIDISLLTFKNENEEKSFFKDFLNLTKKLELKDVERIITEFSKQDSKSMIIGKALKLVIIQRLSELDPNNDEIFSIIQGVASS